MRAILYVAAALSLVSGMSCKRVVHRLPPPPKEEPTALIRPNVETDFNEDVDKPEIDNAAFVDPLASVIGSVILGPRVYVAPFASVRGDEGQPIFIGAESNVQDGVVLHALETVDAKGKLLEDRVYEVNGRPYAVYVGQHVSMAHQSQVHGPAWVEDDVFVGMQALVFKAHIGKGSVIEPGAKVVGVEVPPNRYVKMGSVLNNQKDADLLPEITEDYPFKNLNHAVVHVNTSFADGYGNNAKSHGDEGGEHGDEGAVEHADAKGSDKGNKGPIAAKH